MNHFKLPVSTVLFCLQYHTCSQAADKFHQSFPASICIHFFNYQYRTSYPASYITHPMRLPKKLIFTSFNSFPLIMLPTKFFLSGYQFRSSYPISSIIHLMLLPKSYTIFVLKLVIITEWKGVSSFETHSLWAFCNRIIVWVESWVQDKELRIAVKQSSSWKVIFIFRPNVMWKENHPLNRNVFFTMTCHLYNVRHLMTLSPD